MKAAEGIWIRGAREHNLKSINVFIPRNKMTVLTGLSGSGKSSLAFDTIYAEGQRRYIESLSSYARYFLEKLKPPDVDSIFGLSPVVAIDQKTISSNPRSTIGTVTEVYDYLRLLYAKLGEPVCPLHRRSLKKTSAPGIADRLMKTKQPVKIFSPVVRGKKGFMQDTVQKYMKMGFVRGRVDGQIKNLDQVSRLSKTKTHHIDILVDQMITEKKYYDRLLKSVELSAELSDGFVSIEMEQPYSVKTYSLNATCPVCFFSALEVEPRLFSFNSPKGACPACNGLGYDEDEEALFFSKVCSACKGCRLRPEALSVLINNKNIHELSSMDFESLELFLRKLSFPPRYQLIAQNIIQKILYDVDVLKKVGVSYLSLNRITRTLSGGEAQRVRLASQLSSVLRGVLYILDEPSIGLHPADSDAFLALIQKIKARDNTVLIVEHDETTIRIADHIVDIGPGAGKQGGHLVAQGQLSDIVKSKNSVTGDYLAQRKKIVTPHQRRKCQHWMELKGAKGNNLKNVNVKIPLNNFICVTGVSGSGKSSLIVDTLYKALLKKINSDHSFEPLPFEKMTGFKSIKKVILVDQKPIGRTSRSVPATYVGVMSLIRQFMALLPQSRVRGYTPSHFSFNVKGGRCDYCEGAGQIVQGMHFLSDAVIPCEMCQGKRYSADILNILYKNKNISDILQMTVREAVLFFKDHPQIYPRLKSLDDVGLSYLILGQSSVTLSGGEAQRIKLTRELSRKNCSGTLYILDEPTTGLHFDDIKKLLDVLNRLVDKGSTVIVIEHNMDVVKSCDYILDLGPRGGHFGGRILACGSPEKVAGLKNNLTGIYLKKALNRV